MPRVFVLVLLTALAAGAARAQVADRYGAAQAPYAPPLQARAAAPPVPPPFRRRMLIWPGKSLAQPTYLQAPPTSYNPPAISPAAYPAMRPPVGYAPSEGRPTPYGQGPWAGAAPPPARSDTRWTGARAYPGMRREAAVASADGFRPVYAAQAIPPAAPSAPGYGAPSGPASPSTAPAGWRPPVWGATGDRRYGYDPTQNHAVRFYSVHRPFGIQPNPAPIPPQFFTNTADLTQPAAPLAEERTTGSGKAVRAQPDTSVQ